MLKQLSAQGNKYLDRFSAWHNHEHVRSLFFGIQSDTSAALPQVLHTTTVL